MSVRGGGTIGIDGYFIKWSAGRYGFEREKTGPRAKTLAIDLAPASLDSPRQRADVALMPTKLDHVLILSENHLRRVITRVRQFLQRSPPRLTLDRQQPIPRPLATEGGSTSPRTRWASITTTGVSLDEI